MAQYSVPQDVEADDKLIGPFTFRQFIYLVIAAALGGVAFFLFKIFPLLAIIPVPPIILLLTLALPLKKDQPMETYLAALVSFYTKPHKRIWEPGQPESTIIITAPKQVEDKRTKDLSGEEASHRLSFLADIVDTEGYAIKSGQSHNQLSQSFNSEALNATDIFDEPSNYQISQTLQASEDSRHDALVAQMRQAIDNNNDLSLKNASIEKFGEKINSAAASPSAFSTPNPAPTVSTPSAPAMPPNPIYPSPSIQPVQAVTTNAYASSNSPAGQTPDYDIYPSAPAPTAAPMSAAENFTAAKLPTPGQVLNQDGSPVPPSLPDRDPSFAFNDDAENYEAEQSASTKDSADQADAEEEATSKPSQDLIDLANNDAFSIETIAKQAKRINKKKDDNEVYISLH